MGDYLTPRSGSDADTQPAPGSLWHRGDPATSKRAALRAGAAGVLRAHQAEVLALVQAHPGLTARELAGKGSLDYWQIQRRVNELIRDGLVRREGERGGCSCLYPTEAQP